MIEVGDVVDYAPDDWVALDRREMQVVRNEEYPELFQLSLAMITNPNRRLTKYSCHLQDDQTLVIPALPPVGKHAYLIAKRKGY
jgi:hypothetical protein